MRKTGGTLTTESIQLLKKKPVFKDITEEDIMKGKKLLEKKETGAIKDVEPKKTERDFIKKTLEPTSLFDRYRKVGKYQTISTELRPFGYEFFSDSAKKLLIPRKDIPVSPDYIVGPGDEIIIMLWGRVNDQYNLVVDRDGNITIPQIGPLQVSGMRFNEMKDFLAEQAEQIVGANISVTMGSLKSIQVFVLGEVKSPSSYTLDSFSTITSALLAAGGPTDIGSLRNIQLKRNSKTMIIMDFYDFLLKGDKSQDMILQSGDVVFIPTVGPLTGIAGNVKRPAIYELKKERDLLSLLKMAGGVIPSAYTQQIQVERIQKSERQIVIDIDDKNLTKSKDFILQDGDLVKVFSIVDRDVNVVFLAGNIKRPGKYEYKPGMKVKDLIKDAADLLQETYFEYSLIKRLVLPDMKEELIPFNLGRLLFQNDAASNIELKPQDKIYVFSKWFFTDRPFAIVEGEVRNLKTDNSETGQRDMTSLSISETHPDRLEQIKEESPTLPLEQINVPLFENSRVKDAILEAGGLTKDASLQKGEIFRTDEHGQVTQIYFNVGLAMTEDPNENILLQDRDRIVIHSIWEKKHKQTVSIDGDVRNPGEYPLAENMHISDLVFAAGSILESAYIEEAEVSSYLVENGESVQIDYRTINLRLALENDPSHNLLLNTYDRVFIKRIPDWQERIFANITGEINFPGRYIIKKGERLASLIERAGGYTNKAYLRGVVFKREAVREIQQKSLDEMIARLERTLLAEGSAQVSTALSRQEIEAKKVELAQQQKFIVSLKDLKATGRMAIRLAHLRLLKGSEYDIELEDGDSLSIPTKNSVINVIGAVMSRGSFVYSDRLDYKDYIALAGGYMKYADDDNVYVLKVDGTAMKLPNGHFNWNNPKSRWEATAFSEDIKTLEPGDSIVVPEKLDRIAWLREIKDITQIIFQIAVTAGVLIVAF
jgi:protein involved in polysaccharide export with SLBB domain